MIETNTQEAYMRTITRVFLSITLFSLVAWPGALMGAADYPTRAITLIVPYPAGGVTDLGARAVADSLEKHLKQPVVVVNKVGGSTMSGGYAVASAKPDGYTLGFFPIAAAIPEAYAYFQDAPYSSKDLRPICGAVATAYTITVKEDAPWKTLKELIEYAKKNPGMKAGTGGKQTLQSMLLNAINRTEKTGFVPVPFAGDPQNLAALLGGHTQVGLFDFSVAKSLWDAKKVRVLATVTEKRAEFAPSVPTVVELGYPILYVSVLGINAPKGVPEEVVKKIEDLTAKVSKEQDFQTKIHNTALQVNYQDSATYMKSLAKYKENILAFFKEEGLVK
jgi:tripartite-type tricarboxylate transporter receptor subunit TctC